MIQYDLNYYIKDLNDKKIKTYVKIMYL